LEGGRLGISSIRNRLSSWTGTDVSTRTDAGAAFAFITSFDEAVVLFFISSVSDKTLSRKLFEDVNRTLTPVITAAATIIMVASFLVVTAIHLGLIVALGHRPPEGERGGAG